MATRDGLHRLIDELPECDLQMAESLITWRHELRDDPLLLTLATAPLDDEPDDPPEEAALTQETREQADRGELVPLEEIRRDLGL
jgi:hypothetical protein